MKFPVDLLADVSQAELEHLADNYMNKLLYSNPDSPEYLTLSDSTQVTISISSVGTIPLYGSSDKQKILALFAPNNHTTVALYLLDQWWTVDDILKTADPARDGTMEVETVGERIVLYILNRVVYRDKEKSIEDLPFLCHGEKDHAKILWNNGEAVGFYSVKPSGSLCNSLSTRSYLLPVMDSIFVRKCQRGKGFGLQMLEDFVLSFKEDCLGLRYPLTKSMYKVCEKYLCQYPGDADLLWEVESIGWPNQRTNIASKIQSMDLSISKSLSYTEESIVITEVIEKDVVMEGIAQYKTQIQEAESMEYTVEIVEEMTVVRATKEAEVPVAARGRSSGSKQRNMGEKITEDKSEKVIRIEDIEAEAPREDQVSAQQKTDLHDVSELVEAESVVSMAPEKEGENLVHTAPEVFEVASTMPDKPATVLASQDLEEADVTSAPTTVEPQVEDDATQDLNNTSHDSQITVENVASEIEEAEEECQKKDAAVLPEVVEVHEEAETLNKVGEGTQIEVTDKKSGERIIQHVVNLSTHATSEGGEAGKTGRTVAKGIKSAESETPRRRSQQQRKLEEGVKEQTTAQDGGRVLRGRTVLSTPTPKRKYKRHNQKVYEELEKEVDEVAEENDVCATGVVEELAATEGEEPEEITPTKEDVVAVGELREEEKQQLEEEHLTDEEETEKQEEPGVEDTMVKRSSTELTDTAETALTEDNVDEKVTDESEKEQKAEEVEVSVIQDKQDVSDDEIEEPPVVHKRVMRGGPKATPKPKPTKQSKRHQKQEHTDEADLGEGGSASEEKADEIATDKQMGEHHQMEQDETVDKTEVEISSEDLTVVKKGTIPEADEAAEDLIPLTEVNVEECKEVQQDEETEGGTETVTVMEADKEEEADDMIQEPAASETVIPDEVLDDAVPVAGEPQEKDIGCEIPKLQEATVILLDLKTTCHHLCVKEAEETAVDGECAAPEKEQMELIGAEEEEEVSVCVAEKQTAEPEMLVLEEEDGEKQESSTGKSVDVTAEAGENEELKDSSDEEKEETAKVEGQKSDPEEAPFIETRVLRSGGKIIEASCQEQQEDNIGEVGTEKEMDEAETGTVEVGGEREVVAKDAVTVTAPVEESTVSAVSAVEEREEKNAEEIAVSEREENLQPEIDAEEGNAVAEAGQDAVEEQSEAMSKTFAEREGGASGKEYDERMPVMGGEEVEPPPVAVTRTLRSGGKISKAPAKNRSSRSKKQQDEDKEEGGASVEKSTVTEEEKGVSEEGPVTVTEEEEDIGGLTAAADDLIQDGETDAPLPKPATNLAMLTPREEEATPSAEEQQSEEMPPQLADCQRLTVVLVDLKKTHHEVQEVTATVKEGVPVGKTAAAEAEEEQREETTKEEETMTEEHVPGSPVGIEKTELEKVVVEEEGFGEKVEDTVTIQDTVEGRAEETAEEDESKSVDDEEEEATVPKTRTRRSGKQVGESTPRRKLARRRQKKGEAEKKETPEMKEDTAVKIRDLRRGRKSIPVTERRTTKRTHKQLQEEEGGEESIAIEETQAKEEQEQTEEDATQQVENIEAEMDVEKVNTVTEEAVILSEERQAGSAGTNENTEADDVPEEAVTAQDTVEEQSTSISEAALLTAKEDAPVVETRALSSGEKTERATARSKTTETDEQEVEAAGEESTEDEPAEETRVLRTGRRSAAATPRRKSKRARTQCEEEEEGEDETSQAEEIEVEETKGDQKEDNSDEKIEEQDGEEPVAEKEENTQPEVEMEKVEAVAEESFTEQETVEEEQCAVLETCANGQEETPVEESAEETPNTDEEEAPVVETRVLRSGGKAIKATKSQQEENEQEGTVVERSADADEPAVETRVLRKGRRSATATPRHKAKRARTQCQPEEEDEKETTPAEEIEGEEEDAELPEEKGEKPEEEEKSMETGVEKNKDVEEEDVESVAGEESAVGDAEQMKDGSTEEAAGLEKQDNSMAAVDETGTDVVKVVETNSAEKEETTVTEKSTAAAEVGFHTAFGEEEALVADESAVTEEETPTVTTRTLRSKTKTVHATPSRSRRQGVVETQQHEENPEDEGTQEVHQLTDDSPQNRELNPKEQAETDETSPTGPEAGHPAEDNAEDQAEETADLLDDRAVEVAGEEPATEETESPEEEPPEGKEDKTVNLSGAEGRSLRGRIKTVADKAEDIQLPKRRSIRKRARVDYRENDEDEGSETEAAPDKDEVDEVELDEDKDNKKAECSANEPKLEESSREENLDNNTGAVENTSEKEDIINLALDTDEEVEIADLSQEDEEDEQNMSEEEVEPIVIGNRVLRGRTVPSVVITPQSKFRRRSATVQKSEESLSDEKKSPQSAQKRSLRKRKSTEVTPTRTSKRHSRL